LIGLQGGRKGDKGGYSVPTLLENAFIGGNIIPTVLLILVVLYWIIVILGVLDFDFLDLDLDLDAGDGPFLAILTFLKVGELPFMFVLSVLILNFWIIAMLMYYLPIATGGILNTVLLIPAMMLSLFITKLEFFPLTFIIKYRSIQSNSLLADKGDEMVEELCFLKCEVKDGRLGQAEIKREGASVVINVKSEYEGVSFQKDEVAFVNRKDTEKNIYYIVKNGGVSK
jgi:hypothetical protein